MYLQFPLVKEPSKNHDIWVQVLFGSVRGRVRFHSVRVLAHFLNFRVHVRFLAKPGFWFVRTCWVRVLSHNWCTADMIMPRPARVTGRLHGTIVGPTGRSDWSVQLVGPTIVSCKRFVRQVGQTVGCLISSDCRSDCRSVWTLRPTGRDDRPVGRPITLQRRRYLLLTS